MLLRDRGDLSIVQVLINKGACLDCIDKVSDYITTCTFIIITG